jgi:hypothetical protein
MSGVKWKLLSRSLLYRYGVTEREETVHTVQGERAKDAGL